MKKEHYARTATDSTYRAFTIRVSPNLHAAISKRAMKNKRSMAAQVEIELESLYQ